MKVTALFIAVLGLVAGAPTSDPQAVLTVFGNVAETEQVQATLAFAQIGTEEDTTNFIPFTINGKIIQVALGFKLSDSGDDGLLQFRFHSEQDEDEEYDVNITGNYVFMTPEGEEYSSFPYSAPLSTQSPASQWVPTETKEVIKDKLLTDGILQVIVELNY